jgi:predicted ester cyclase
MGSDAESVMREWFDQVWNDGDESAIDRLFHPDGVFRGLPTPDGQPIRGPVEFKPFHRAFLSALPDMRITLLHTVCQGDLVLAHCRVTGMHRGDGLGVPATERHLDFYGFALGRVEGGQLREGWNCFDFLDMYRQLGVELALPAGSPPVGVSAPHA